jgi:GNAT superfamily N-acetyltransferase
MAIIIRRGNSTDLATVQHLNKELFEFEHRQGFYPDDSFNLNWPYEEGTKYFEECLSPSPGSAVFIAEAQGKAVGYLCAASSSRAWRSVNPIAELENMYVDESYRRQGVGSLLVESFKEWAKDNGAARIRVGAFSKNVRALGFYHKCGFRDLEIHLEQSLD